MSGTSESRELLPWVGNLKVNLKFTKLTVYGILTPGTSGIVTVAAKFITRLPTENKNTFFWKGFERKF